MKKKGVSPLIATVLLIGFAISIAAVAAIWSVDYLKQQSQKEDLRIGAESICATGVEISVKSAKCVAGKINDFVIKNGGSEKIVGFTVRIEGDKGIEVVTAPNAINQNEQKSIIPEPSYSVSKVGAVESLEVIPIIKNENFTQRCTEMAIKTEC